MNAKELLEGFIDVCNIKSKIKCAIIPVMVEGGEDLVILSVNYSNQEFREFNASLALSKTLDEDLLGNIPIVWFKDGSWAIYRETDCGVGYSWYRFKCPEIPTDCL